MAMLSSLLSGEPLVVRAYRGAGTAVGIALGAKLVAQQLLLCALGKVPKNGALQTQHAAASNEWAFIKVPQGYASPSKNSMKAPTTPEPCTPRFRSAGMSESAAVISHPIVISSGSSDPGEN